MVSDVCNHQAASFDATRGYAEATSSSVRFLISKNERMTMELQTTNKGEELVTTSTRAELKNETLDEVLSLDTVMQVLYSKFGTVHKAVVHLNGWLQRCARRAHILSNVHVAVDSHCRSTDYVIY